MGSDIKIPTKKTLNIYKRIKNRLGLIVCRWTKHAEKEKFNPVIKHFDDGTQYTQFTSGPCKRCGKYVSSHGVELQQLKTPKRHEISNLEYWIHRKYVKFVCRVKGHKIIRQCPGGVEFYICQRCLLNTVQINKGEH
jgi:hypothetical protein